jgi:DUF4097 and DUF4098 domain-containing protein YvlB
MKSSLALAVAAVSLALAVPSRAETRIEKNLKLEPGGELRLETDLGAVSVTGGSGSGAHVVITSRRKDLEELLRFQFEEGAHSVTITAKKRHSFDWFSNLRDRVQYEIQVPADTRLSIETSGGGIKIAGTRGLAKLETSGGGIDVHDLVGDLEAHTSGGGIRLRDLKGSSRVDTSGGGIEGASIDGPIHAQSSGGSIDLDRVTGDIDAETSGGGIRLVEAGGRVRADTSGGGIHATFARGNAKGGTLETSGGGIDVALDPSVDLGIEASGNSVKTDLPLKVRGEISRGSLSGELGKGGNRLRMHTSGGSVRIQAL